MTKLRNVNLNLLPILRELLHTCHVTQAANALNMSQPAVSEALARLREIFKDELLVPQGRVLVRTAMAERLMPLTGDALDRVEALLSSSDFEPGELRGTIKIATADYVILILGPPLLKRLAREAPGLVVQFSDVSTQSGTALNSGLLDFILVPKLVGFDISDFRQEFLFEDELVCVVDADSPVKGKITVEDFRAARFAFFSSGGDKASSFQALVLQQVGTEHSDVVHVPSFMVVPFLVGAPGSMAITQRRLAERVAAAANVRILPPPWPLPKLQIQSVWNGSKEHDPVHRWFRQLMHDVSTNEI